MILATLFAIVSVLELYVIFGLAVYIRELETKLHLAEADALSLTEDVSIMRGQVQAIGAQIRDR